MCPLGPVGTRRNNNVFITPKRRRRRRFDVMKTLSLRHFCVMCPLGGDVCVWNKVAGSDVLSFIMSINYLSF